MLDTQQKHTVCDEADELFTILCSTCIYNDVYCFLDRSKLPGPMLRRDQFSLWTVLKQCIGKELSKITMPVVFNEPMSFLQRMSEYVEHAQLLIKADSSEDPVDRMKVSNIDGEPTIWYKVSITK